MRWLGGILMLWIWSLLCIPPWYPPLAREELSEKWPSGRQYEVYKPGMFVQDGNGSALTRGNKQAAVGEKRHGLVQWCEPAGGYVQNWPSWTGKVCLGCNTHKGVSMWGNGMETKLSQAEAFKTREKFQSELNEMAKVFVHAPLVITACSTAGSSSPWKISHTALQNRSGISLAFQFLSQGASLMKSPSGGEMGTFLV